MRKRRNIPTIPIECLSEGKDKAKYQKILYGSILEGVEQSLKTDKPSFVMARVDDGRNVRDISILKESFQTNLETVLNYYEQNEEYELCSRTVALMKKIK